jgi:aryl-alcohol dehydrogenase-like predicted oxidoreductase
MANPLPTHPFGRTGHESTRVLFGAAALHSATQEQADRALDALLAAGVNHIDTAASYGDSELRIGPWMREHRGRFFLATKTGERTHAGARDQIRRSLERLRVDRVDLIQLHNLVKEEEWALALSEDGALRACVEAREEGLVRFIGVTGHGTRVASMHARSLDRFAFDAVLLPWSVPSAADAAYAADFAALRAACEARGVAMQTIKAIARRRWPEGATPTRTTWYEPLEDPREIERAVHFVLRTPGLFVNSAGDLALLPSTIAAVRSFAARAASEPPPPAPAMEPLFVRGYAGA